MVREPVRYGYEQHPADRQHQHDSGKANYQASDTLRPSRPPLRHKQTVDALPLL